MKYLVSLAVALTAFQSFAQSSGGGSGGGGDMFGAIMPMILIVVVFYFLIIRPQQKKVKTHKEMVANLAKNDKIVTAGGIHGKVIKVADNEITVEIAKDVKVIVQRETISALIPKKTAGNKNAPEQPQQSGGLLGMLFGKKQS